MPIEYYREGYNLFLWLREYKENANRIYCPVIVVFILNIELHEKTCYTMHRRKGAQTIMARIIGIGHQDFTELITSGCFMWIRQSLFGSGGKIMIWLL